MSATVSFTWSDAWLLLSVILAAEDGSGASLKDVIAVGDAINKAIFNPQELRRGMAKLTGAGYVVESDNLYFPTKSARQLGEKVAGEYLLDRLEGLKRLLSVRPDPGDNYALYEDPQWPYPKLTDEMVTAAAGQHRDEVFGADRRPVDKDAGA